MVIRRTKRRMKKAARSLRKGIASQSEQAWPKYDLREDLHRDVQRAHGRIDRLVDRSERLRAKYKKDANLRWLRKSEGIDLSKALEDYREAAARAAVVNRLYKIVARYRRLETCERQALKLIQQQLGGENPSRKLLTSIYDSVRAMHQYLHVKRSRDNDHRVRKRLNSVAALLAASRFDTAFIFRVPVPKPRNEKKT